jgi:predicted phage terminase large subunit-like protein
MSNLQKIENKTWAVHGVKMNMLLESVFTKDFFELNEKAIITDSYYEFFKWAFKVLHPSDPFSDAPHIKELCDVLQKEIFRIRDRKRKTKDIVINIPPRTSKSLIVSIILLPWAWIHVPHLKMIAVSYEDNLTVLNARLCRDLIKSSEYQKYFAHIYTLRTDSDAVTLFTNNKGGSRLSKTTGSSIVGHGAHLIVVDDPQSATTARSEAKRDDVKNYWFENLYNRLTPAQLGLRVLVQQRLHDDDLTANVLKRDKKGRVRHICLPATIDEKSKTRVYPREYLSFYTWLNSVGYLDPIRLDSETLEDLKDALGTFGYTSQYDQNPTSEEGGIIKRHWLKIINPNSVVRDKANEPMHFFLDTAYTDKTAGDASAIIAAFKRGNEVYIVRSESKRLEFPDLCRYLIDFTREYGYDYNSMIYVEPKASGKSLVQQIKATTNLNIVEGESPKDDKLSRLNAVSPKCESGRVFIIEGGWNEDFLTQLCSAGEESWPEHDDEIDAFSMCVKKLLINGHFDFMFV